MIYRRMKVGVERSMNSVVGPTMRRLSDIVAKRTDESWRHSAGSLRN